MGKDGGNNKGTVHKYLPVSKIVPGRRTTRIFVEIFMNSTIVMTTTTSTTKTQQSPTEESANSLEMNLLVDDLIDQMVRYLKCWWFHTGRLLALTNAERVPGLLKQCKKCLLRCIRYLIK
jgi:hypothetical protein